MKEKLNKNGTVTITWVASKSDYLRSCRIIWNVNYWKESFDTSKIKTKFQFDLAKEYFIKNIVHFHLSARGERISKRKLWERAEILNMFGDEE